MSQLPPDPFITGQDGFVHFHEIYLGMRTGGFTRFEAILFLATNVAVNGFIGQNQDPPAD